MRTEESSPLKCHERHAESRPDLDKFEVPITEFLKVAHCVEERFAYGGYPPEHPIRISVFLWPASLREGG